MASLHPACIPCLTYAQIKHHLSYEDFIVVSLYPSLSQTLLLDSWRVLCLTLPLYLLQNSVLACIHVYWRQTSISYSSFHLCHLAKYLAHSRNSKLSQNYWISDSGWLINNEEMRHSGRMSQARFPGLANYSAQVCHRRHLKQILWSVFLSLITWQPIKVEVLIL